jgi:hypothetical protein
LLGAKTEAENTIKTVKARAIAEANCRAGVDEAIAVLRHDHWDDLFAFLADLRPTRSAETLTHLMREPTILPFGSLAGAAAGQGPAR